jgi:hypothetical protein
MSKVGKEELFVGQEIEDMVGRIKIRRRFWDGVFTLAA